MNVYARDWSTLSEQNIKKTFLLRFREWLYALYYTCRSSQQPKLLCRGRRSSEHQASSRHRGRGMSEQPVSLHREGVLPAASITAQREEILRASGLIPAQREGILPAASITARKKKILRASHLTPAQRELILLMASVTAQRKGIFPKASVPAHREWIVPKASVPAEREEIFLTTSVPVKNGNNHPQPPPIIPMVAPLWKWDGGACTPPVDFYSKRRGHLTLSN